MIKTKALVFLLSLILFNLIALTLADAYQLESDWNEYKSEHFIIRYHSSIPNRYIREFTRTCERYYRLIAERLGFKRFDFWSWENRGRIFVYGSREEYLAGSGQAKWSAASVHVQQKLISTYYFAEDFFDQYLPHELSHIVLREFVGARVKLPLWFEEGVPSANEDNCYLRYLLVAKGLVEKSEFIPVAQLEAMGRAALKKHQLFYATSASIVIFLLEDYSTDNFVRLCRSLRDGSSFYGAMNKAYRIRDAEDLNNKFLAYLNKKSYEDIATAQNQSVNW
ncbi:MAG: hypothetical protein HQ595_01540 [Candidatus Omnitrophica bacterium]|nr:hypothetical protein [Candidatus Omnitrophota bacterium]